MSQQPLITIVVPVYNREKLVSRTLDSIAAQSLRPLRLVVVDNNSTDNTPGVLNRWKEANETDTLQVTVTNEPRPGACCARNKGLECVTTPYTMFFDSDDTMSPTHVESINNALLNNPEADVIGWNITLHQLDGSVVKKRFADKDVVFNHVFHASFATQRYVVRTDLLRRVGLWNENLAGWNDYELGVRLALASPLIVKIDKGVGVDVYSQADSITGTGFSSSPSKWEDALDCCELHLRNSNNGKAVKWIETRRSILAGMYRREGNIEESERLLSQVLSRTGSLHQRCFHRFVCHYTSKGGRGVAILAKLFLCKST